MNGFASEWLQAWRQSGALGRFFLLLLGIVAIPFYIVIGAVLLFAVVLIGVWFVLVAAFCGGGAYFILHEAIGLPTAVAVIFAVPLAIVIGIFLEASSRQRGL